MIGVAAAASRCDELDAQFLDLVSADQELLCAEFDAIITAGWGCPVAPGPRPPVAIPASQQGREARSTGRSGTGPGRRCPTAGARFRQRSPPRGRRSAASLKVR